MPGNILETYILPLSSIPTPVGPGKRRLPISPWRYSPPSGLGDFTKVPPVTPKVSDKVGFFEYIFVYINTLRSFPLLATRIRSCPPIRVSTEKDLGITSLGRLMVKRLAPFVKSIPTI